MTFSDTIKGLIFKKPSASRDLPKSAEITSRNSGIDSPYLSARRTWNEHIGSVVSSRQTWQVVGILAMLVALASVGGMIYIGSQSKFIPYVVQVDKMGQIIAAGPVTASDKADPRIIHATIADFIGSARLVTPDAALQRKAILKVYAVLSPNDPATLKMNEWFNGNADASPFKRATKEMVSIEIKSVIPQSPDTWQLDWVETIRDRQGVMKGEPITMRSLVTVYTAEPTSQTTDEQLRNNPLGIYVRDFSWSRLL